MNNRILIWTYLLINNQCNFTVTKIHKEMVKPVSSRSTTGHQPSTLEGTYRQIIKYCKVYNNSKKKHLFSKPKSKIFRCPHTESRYYARGMCSKCYNMNGRTKLATDCAHTDRPIYAKNMCQVCYQKFKYNRKKAQVATAGRSWVIPIFSISITFI